MFGEGKQLTMVLFGQMRRQQYDRGQVQLTVGYLLKEDRKSPRESGCARSAKGGFLGHAQFVHTVCVEARATSEAMDAAGLDFG